MKKIFLIILLQILSSCVSYNTVDLLETEKYKYKISYSKKWRFSKISTETINIIISTINEYDKEYFNKLSDNTYLIENAYITKKDFDGVIYIYFLNKESVAYKDICESIENKSCLYVNFLDKKDRKTKVYLKNIYNWRKRKNQKVAFLIENKMIILFDLRGVMFSLNSGYGNDGTKNRDFSNYSEKERKIILREFYKIISSLKRYQFNNIFGVVNGYKTKD